MLIGHPAPTIAPCPDEPTFTPPLCDDGNPAPTVAGCPDEPTFTPPLCSKMVIQHQQSLDVQMRSILSTLT